MGLFSKTEVVCKMCGKTYHAGFFDNANYCKECDEKRRERLRELEDEIYAYEFFSLRIYGKSLELEEAEEIAKRHKEKINRLAHRGGKIEIPSDVVFGSVFSKKFFVTAEGMVVDSADVFAIAMQQNTKLSDAWSDTIMFAIFTNDPDVPVFPFAISGKVGLFSMKSKNVREATVALLHETCPNLQYPISPANQLNKQIKQEGVVKGKLEVEFVREQLNNLYFNSEMFDAKNLATFGGMEEKVLHELGCE